MEPEADWPSVMKSMFSRSGLEGFSAGGMVLAILELGDLERHLLGLGLGLLAHVLQFLPDLGALLDLVDDDLGQLGVLVEEIADKVLDLVDDIAPDIGVARACSWSATRRSGPSP